jgi:predicted DNA-binding transcriptional regulator YafY
VRYTGARFLITASFKFVAKIKKAERLRWLIDKLNQPNYHIPLQQLADNAGCSLKTIRRYIDQLIDERNAPCCISNAIVHRDKSKQTIELQGHWLNEQELKALFALNQIIDQLSSGALQSQIKPFQQTIEKLLENKQSDKPLNQKIKLIEIAERTVKESIFQTIVESLSANKQLSIVFWQRENDHIEARTISPLQLVRYKDNWKLDAWCHLREALRTFSLEAIQSIKPLATKSKIIPTNTLKTHFESSYGIFAGQANKHATLLFSPYIARWVQFEHWHPKQIGTLNKEGSYQLTIPYHKDKELIQDILKHGHHVKVLEPPDLKQKIQQELKKTLAQY